MDPNQNQTVDVNRFLQVAQRAYQAHISDFQQRSSAAHQEAGEPAAPTRGAIDIGSIGAIAGTICRGWRIGWPILRPMIKAIAIFRPETGAAIMAAMTAFNDVIMPGICAAGGGDTGTGGGV
jgi:hypothetical protein